MYDLLIVGAGITAATLVARLKSHLRICVIDCRNHLGGNCFDESSEGSQIHRYGPHIFHCPSERIKGFLDHYTDWVPYSHRVLAEVVDGPNLRFVPFPYCRQTVQALGRELSEPEILEMFFRGYSQKMWGMAWEQLPSAIRGRIPMELTDKPTYYRHAFVALPAHGYTHMIGNMLDGAEIILGAPPGEWLDIAAQEVVYTGRPDLIPMPGESATLAELNECMLNFRTLDIAFDSGTWGHPCISLHACSMQRPWTRKTRFAEMTGGESPIVSTETPRRARADELNPYYPIELAANRERFVRLAGVIQQAYPHLHLAGRLGSYRYFDMYQAVGQALALAEKIAHAHAGSFERAS